MQQVAYDFERNELAIGDEVIFYTAPAWLRRGHVVKLRPYTRIAGTLVEVVTTDGTQFNVIPGLCARVLAKDSSKVA